MTHFTPLGASVHVRLTKPAEKTASGIYLPQIRAHQATEGTVLATGPGYWVPEASVVPPRVQLMILEGDIVLFPQHLFRPLEGDEGTLSDEEIVATVDPEDNSLTPEGDWVLVDPDEKPILSAGGIALADSAKQSPRSGVVLDMGRGRLRFRGPFAGLRYPVWRSLSLSNKEALLGKRAYWSAEAEILRAAGQALVRGRELLCVEEK